MESKYEVGLSERIRLAQTGDTAMQDALVADNLNLVRSVVRRFGLRGEEWEDLFQTGCIGLIKAILRFDSERKVRFSTYAVPMIVGELRQYFRDNQKIRISRSLWEVAQKVKKTNEILRDRKGREPTVKEIARYLGMTTALVTEAMEAIYPISSLDEVKVCPHSGTHTLLDSIADDGVRPDDVERLFLAERMAKLPLREKEILRRRFWQDKTQAEVADQLGISQVHVSRLEKKALFFLRQEQQESKSG